MDRFMFKILVPNPSAEELGQFVTMTQKTMDEVACAACNGEELLRMREVAKSIPIAKEVLEYAMVMIASTHADSEVATDTTKKYIRAGASPRAAQALITAAKVRALIKGRYNVSWEFNYTPNVDKWRSGVVSALTQYSAGKADWQTVEKAFVDGWAEQYAASHK
jgi:MoxR-like ATPase